MKITHAAVGKEQFTVVEPGPGAEHAKLTLHRVRVAFQVSDVGVSCHASHVAGFDLVRYYAPDGTKKRWTAKYRGPRPVRA